MEVLGGDCRIRMDRKEPRVIRESRDGGGVCRGNICGEEEVENRANTLPWGTPDLTTWQVEHVVLYRTWK